MDSSMGATSRRREKELKQQRESGALPPQMDVATNKPINPHNPEFLTKRPWYLGESGPSLTHHGKQKKDRAHVVSMAEADDHALQQRRKATAIPLGTWIEAMYRGKTPYLPARVEKARDDGTLDLVFEQGRKQASVPRSQLKLPKALAGARAGLEDLGKVSYDAKRDRWHGYEPAMHADVEEKYAEIDAARAKRKEDDRIQKLTTTANKRQHDDDKTPDDDDDDDEPKGGDDDAKTKKKKKKKKRQQQDDKKKAGGSDSESDVDSADDGDSDKEEFQLVDEEARDFQGRVARQGGVGGAQMKTTVRNLRIREDTAKYLRNLDPNSAYYDPKSRAMRENPTPHVDPKDLAYAGDNFARATGDALELAKTQVFAWDATKDDANFIVQAEPSRAELLRKTTAVDDVDARQKFREALAAKYGSLGEEAEPVYQSETYREFSKDGTVKQGFGPVSAAARSKYVEDVFPHNHTSVWGSFFCPVTFQWGFADDHSVVRNSFATGDNGKKANDDARLGRSTLLLSTTTTTGGGSDDDKKKPLPPADTASSQRKKKRQHNDVDALYGVPDYANVDLDEAKVQEAIRRQKRHGDGPPKDSKYTSGASTQVTLEEMEAYRRTKINKDDPMRDFLSS
eukprot:CAMPEP_0118915480 /NCGR_PEP_ID=MMETSP1166-20130328/15638_1 /TAXON_ID=1104430 /ORGANISM="Chrysoreinhardia sp, Strain CCMP3193" /LENGTH=624 /DNA_ID=CAMNT_0006855179 /DNA_START=1 /DNA_END=1875 /DNA_ORIENTATION=+